MATSARFRNFEFVPGETLIFIDEIEIVCSQDCSEAIRRGRQVRMVASGFLLGIRMK